MFPFEQNRTLIEISKITRDKEKARGREFITESNKNFISKEMIWVDVSTNHEIEISSYGSTLDMISFFEKTSNSSREGNSTESKSMWADDGGYLQY